MRTGWRGTWLAFLFVLSDIAADCIWLSPYSTFVVIRIGSMSRRAVRPVFSFQDDCVKSGVSCVLHERYLV